MYKNTCADCRHCDREGYCEIKDTKVKPDHTCPEFEEN